MLLERLKDLGIPRAVIRRGRTDERIMSIALVVGAAGLDLKVPARAPPRLPLGRSNPGEIRWGWGGVARNMAENLARLGTEVQLITAVGDDWWGRALSEGLANWGLAPKGVLS